MQPVKQRQAVILVGYKTRPVADELLRTLTPEFKPAAALSDPAKIAASVEERRQAFLAEAARLPYTATFDSVSLRDTYHDAPGLWHYRPPQGGKPPVAVAVARWLLARHPQAWAGGLGDRAAPGVVFVGFDPRTFVKLLGLECSLPEVAEPLPPRLWYDAADGYRDIAEAVLPREAAKTLGLREALVRRRPVAAADAAKWDKVLADWQGPGGDAEADVWLVTELASQLGFLSSWAAPPEGTDP